MKKLPKILTVLMLAAFMFSCSDDDGGTTDPPVEGDVTAKSYYPGETGTTHTYEGELADTAGTQDYERQATYQGTTTFNGTAYTQQRSVVTNILGSSTADLYFRTTDTGMFIYIDTTGLSSVIDSLAGDFDLGGVSITFNIDPEIRLLAYPFESTPNWDAFSLSATLGGLINLEIVGLEGNYRGQETITIPAAEGSLTAEKIEYIATLTIPESLTESNTIEFSTFAWFVQDIGLVKLEGSGLIAGALSGGEIELGDSTSTVTETLIQYNIR